MNKSFFSITAASVEKYLVNKGWQRDYLFANKKLIVLKRNENAIAIPASETNSDFYVRLKDIIYTISHIFELSENQIIKEIVTTNIDRLEFRIVSNLSSDGRLPLRYAAKCVEGLKELVLYSACAESRAQPICFRAGKAAMKYLDSFKLAQTEVGSFIFNVEIQVINEDFDEITLGENIAPAPFEHKIVKRINTALSQVNDIVEKQVPVGSLLETAYKEGITANMCDALLKLDPENDNADVYTSFYYASSLREKNHQPEPVKLSSMHFYVIEDIAKRYRDNRVVENVELTGKVSFLRRPGGAEDDIIHLNAENDGYKRSITVLLSEDHFRLACDAVKERKRVFVSGELDKSNERNWTITDVRDFKKLD